MREFIQTAVLIDLFYAPIIEWAQIHDYHIPSKTWLNSYKVIGIDARTFEGTYNGQPVECLGQHCGGTKTITFATHHSRTDILNTLAHEYAHAIQIFTIGRQFYANYRLESNKSHSSNKYENEARDLSQRVDHYMGYVENPKAANYDIVQAAYKAVEDFRDNPTEGVAEEPIALPKCSPKDRARDYVKTFIERHDWYSTPYPHSGYGPIKYSRKWWLR